MGCLCQGGVDEPDKKFAKGGENDLSDGPVKKRGCTDAMCIPLLIAAQVIFVIVTVAGFSAGDPSKLYKPRDFRGAYCGVESNLNEGPNTKSQPKLAYTMNVTATVDTMMKQLICSSAARTALVSGDGSTSALLTSQAEKDKYLCDCCLVPCGQCDSALLLGDDLSIGNLKEVISKKMQALTDPSNAKNLFDPAGSHGEMFSSNSFWNSATKYFNQVCLPECSLNTTMTRTYVYKPSNDSKFSAYWELLANSADNPLASTMASTIQDSFTFAALPLSKCPYSAERCVLFPGINLKEAAADYCTFEMGAEVVQAIGSAASSVLGNIGKTVFAGQDYSEAFGTLAGDILQALDVFALVSVLAFVVGFAFLVLLRFLVGCCVWIAVGVSVFIFLLGGGLMFTLSGQCEGAGLFESGKQVAVAVAVTAKVKATNVANNQEAESEHLKGESDSGYRGVQHRTKDGYACANWDTQTTLPGYNPNNYPNAGLTKNYCRNPFETNATNKAATIWCVTTDPDVMWGECTPVGVLQPECPRGYAIAGKTSRDVLYYGSIVVWSLGGVWVIVIIFLINRIRLAIALNKVACEFLMQNPGTLMIPVLQIVIAVLWGLVWLYSASFLLSQVPDSYTPKQAFATYEEAYGTSGSCAFWEFGDHCNGTPGQCTSKWPTGSVWKDSACDFEDGIAKCWRCAPPRYIFDVRFAASFFVFLWNNAFNIAMGQILIAMCVGLWYFSPNGRAHVLGAGTRTVCRYHIGTVAFGSLIVAIVQFVRYLMKYMSKQAQAQKNKLMQVAFKCLECCVWCFEKCVKFLNKNAYIQTALMGTNFCTSAKKAFYLILRNALRFGTVATLSVFIYYIGLVFIVSCTSGLGYLLLRAQHPEISPLVPTVFFAMIAYVAAKLYLNVFSLAVDTCLQCYIATEEMGTYGNSSSQRKVLTNFLSSFWSSESAKRPDQNEVKDEI